MYLFGHEVGGDDGGRAGPAHHAVHHDGAAPTHGLLDELVGPREEPVDGENKILIQNSHNNENCKLNIGFGFETCGHVGLVVLVAPGTKFQAFPT